MRDTKYATELCSASVPFHDGSEGRLERLRFKNPPVDGKEGYRFSWWKDDRMTPRPLDLTEEEMINLIRSAIEKSVFSEKFLVELRQML